MCHPVSPTLSLQPVTIQQSLPHSWPPHLLQAQTQHPWHPPQHQSTNTSVPGIHVKPEITPTSGSSACPKTPHVITVIPSTKTPQFCHNPQIPPIEAYITVVEQASSKFPTQDADELRADINWLLKQQHTQSRNHWNINPTQCRQGGGHGHYGPRRLHQQGQHTTTRFQHIQSSQKGPNQQPQKQINIHPQGHKTNRSPQHLQIQTILSHQCSPTRFYGLPKIHKVGTHLRPIVSHRGSITYGVAKELSYIIKPLVGQSPHHLKTPNTLFYSYGAKGWNQGRSSPPLMSRLFLHQYQLHHPSK